MKLSRSNIILIMLLLFATIVIVLLLRGPIAQELAYHNFSDENTIFGIPNFWNVISNLPFLIIGFLGLRSIKKSQLGVQHAFVLYFGIGLVGIGSGYYHLDPTNDTLVWDRLPMTICFMTLFSVLVRDFLNTKRDRLTLIVLLVIGLYSIFHWIQFGDLRPYALVQFFPMLCIPIMLLTQKSRGVAAKPFWVLLLWYVLAKGAETWDVEIHETLSMVSGHSLKHLFAAIGLYQFYRLTRA
ncbi:MAG: ceramidase domain-containing protein [Bacteroidia bacterium]